MTLTAAFVRISDWALRIARTIALTMFALVPVHFFVSCDASGTLAGFTFVLLLVVAGLSIVARRFKPFGLALIAMLLHVLSTH